jgi:hypothetical protein
MPPKMRERSKCMVEGMGAVLHSLHRRQEIRRAKKLWIFFRAAKRS